MREIKLYDSKSKQLTVLKPKYENEVIMYVCGPTVYNHAHIGNARPLIVFDNLKRLLKEVGYKVTFISNYTDVDDKIINTAKAESISELEVSNKYIKSYEDLRAALHIANPDITPRVTQNMDKIIQFIDKLVQDGYAYVIDGDVYFRVSKIKDYGCVSNRNIDDLLVGARIEENEKKESPLDFTLWKATIDGIKWDSPWSIGRPGWHTECVAMINSLTKDHYVDIHGGGMDLKFPHHENELAQAKAYNHHELAGIWMHNGMVNINNEKMSKSLGNVIWPKDIIATFGFAPFKWVFNNTHYRAPINFSVEIMSSAKQELVKIYTPLKQACVKLSLASVKISEELNMPYYDKFMDCLCDDLNTTLAISVIYDAIKQLNMLVRSNTSSLDEISILVNTINRLLYLVGMDKYEKLLTIEEIELYNKWNEYKGLKDFANADIIRNKLIERNIL